MSAFADPDRELEALATFDFTGHSEASIREQWISPLLRLLGYGIGTVDMPFKVAMRAPVRALGSHKWEADYRPTVYGMGLWIIEAKNPAEDVSSDMHLGQAWAYATHTRINVPLMMMANGRRICIHDVTQDEWDIPIVDIEQQDLRAGFGELSDALGARRVAEFVRQRQLRHLRTALLAQLDDEALEKTMAEVAELVAEARPIVSKRRGSARVDAIVKSLAERDIEGRAAGVAGLAQAWNSPHMGLARDIALCVDMILERPSQTRAAVFGELETAAHVRGTTRMTMALRALRFGVALRLAGAAGCSEAAAEAAETMARDGAKDFPDNPLGASAHRFEIALAAFIGRLVLGAGTDAALAAEKQIRSRLDVEAWLRQEATLQVGASATLQQHVELTFRKAWFSFEPWTSEALDAAASTLRAGVEKMPARRDVNVGGASNPFYELRLQSDPLRLDTYRALSEVALPARPEPFEQVSEEARALATRILAQHFPEGWRP